MARHSLARPQWRGFRPRAPGAIACFENIGQFGFVELHIAAHHRKDEALLDRVFVRGIGDGGHENTALAVRLVGSGDVASASIVVAPGVATFSTGRGCSAADAGLCTWATCRLAA